MTITDLKVLVQSKKRDGDSPLKQRRPELEEQWKRRLERYNKVVGMVPMVQCDIEMEGVVQYPV